MKSRFPLFVVVILYLTQSISFGQAPPLGSASSFALFTANGAFTNTGASVVTGDVGNNVGAFTGFPPGTLIGAKHVADAVSATAATGVAVAYGYLSTLGGSVLGVSIGNGQILTPGVYNTGAAATLNGNLTLDAQGDPNAIFIIRIGGAFATGTNSNVILINSANLCNVYWQIGGQFDLAEGSVFRGTIVADGAIHLLEGSTFLGRALSVAGAIEVHNNVVTNSCSPCVAPAAPTASVTIQPDCVISTGTITVTVPAPGAGIIYTLTGTNPFLAPVTNATGIFSGLAPGIYNVTTTTNAECASAPILLTVNAVPEVPAAPAASVTTQPTCIVSTGTITVTAPAPGSGITYTVTGTNPVVAPITNATGIFAGLVPGNYGVTTSLAGCISAPISLIVNAVPGAPAAPTATVTQPTCFVATGTITVTAPAPGAGITYTLTGTNPYVAPVTNATGIFAGLASGIYNVTTTTNAECASAPILLTVNAVPEVPAAPAASVTTQPTCIVSTGTITVTAPAPGSGITYTVTGTNPVVAPITNATGIFAGLVPGNYGVTTSLAGCISAPISLIVNAVPGAPAAPAASVTIQPDCVISTGTIIVSTPASGTGITYTLTGTNPFVAPVTNATGIFAGLAPGIYNVTTTTNAECASAPTLLTVNAVTGAPAAPNATVTQPTCFVATGAITVTAPAPGAGLTYTLTGSNPYVAPVTNATGIFAGLAPGIYIVTAKSADGCISAATSVTINAPATPTAFVIGTITQPTCAVPTGSVELTGLPSGNWTINPGAITGSTISTIISGLAPGIYSATVTNEAGCTSVVSANVVITGQTPLTTVKTTSTTSYSAVGDLIYYSITVTNNGNLTISGLTLSDPNAIVTCTSQNTLATGTNLKCATVPFLVPHASFTCTAVHTVTQADLNAGSVTNIATATGTDANGCEVTDASNPVTVNAALCTVPIVSVVNNCGSSTLSIPPGGTILWSNGATTASITVTTAGTYTVTRTIDDCTKTGSGAASPMAIPTAPLIGAITQPTCVVATGSVVVTGLPIGDWSINPGAITGSTTNTVIYGLAPGTYSGAVTNAEGCTSVVSANLVINAPPAIPTAPVIGTITQPTCDVPTGSVEITGLPSGNWTINPGAITGSTSRTIITGLAPGIYNGAVTNEAGCTSEVSANVVIIGKTQLTIVKTTSTTSYAAVGDLIHYSITVTNNGDLTISGISLSDPIATITCSGTQNTLATDLKCATVPFLEPHSSFTCTAVHTVTQADLNAGSVTNIATTTGTDANGCTLTDASNPVTVNRTNKKSGVISITLDALQAKNDLKAYPNPTSGLVTFEFQISENAKATLDLSSITGQRITRIFDAEVEAGITQTVIFDQLLRPGVYLYVLRWNNHIITGKFIRQ